jgi:tetratricopeptide (TPR) repeat protein
MALEERRFFTQKYINLTKKPMKTTDPKQYFQKLTRRQILAQPTNQWSDSELLDVMKQFAKDRDREEAVAELILRSFDVDEMVEYSMLYINLAEYYAYHKDVPAALRWFHAMITFEEQHQTSHLHRGNYLRDLAETYVRSGDLATGLAIYTRLAQTYPGDIWTYNSLVCFALHGSELPHLALEVADYSLRLVARKDPERLKEQLQQHRDEIFQSLPNQPDPLEKVPAEVLAAFRAAVLPVTPPQPNPKLKDADPAPYLAPVSQLLAEGAPDATLEAQIVAQGKVFAPELIRMAFDQSLPIDGGPANAVALLRTLQKQQVVDLSECKRWLDQADGNWREQLFPKIGKVGGFSVAELKAILLDTKYALYIRSAASDSLANYAQKRPGLRPQILEIFRVLLTRPESDTAGEETLVGFVLSDLLDLNARELYPEIQRAYVEDRVDTKVVGPDSFAQEWQLTPIPIQPRRKDGLYLRLRCTVCDRERDHFVQKLLLEIGTQEQQSAGKATEYDPYVMDHEIVCPKCGAIDRYAMTPGAFTTLMVERSDLKTLVALFSGDQKAKIKPNPRIHPYRSAVFGKPMHPLQGLELYHRKIANNPKDAHLYLKMGNLLRSIYRPQAALEAHRKAYELAPNNAEIAFALAMDEHDYGDKAAARSLYEQAIALEGKNSALFRPSELALAATQGLLLLKQKKPSSWAAIDERTDPKQALHHSAPPRQSSQSPNKRHRRR